MSTQLQFAFLFGILFTPCLFGYSTASIPEWDYVVFAQQWPESVCIDLNITHQHTCKIAKNITEWTVHGLWPTKAGTIGPNFCNGSKPFDMSKLQEILPELIEYWPNLYSDTPMGDFWSHEWTKHGSCAASSEDMNSEIKYFKKGLEMRSKINLLKILEKGHIVPKDQYTYQYVEVMDAFKTGLGATPSIQCVWDPKTKTQYLAQVELCLSKNFDVIQCVQRRDLLHKGVKSNGVKSPQPVGSASPCRQTETIAYAKIHPQ